jgi:UDP-N-acetylglucosamine:LPS N-acetylglucosamine transferase
MAGEKVLYISASLGLGHIKRDLAIARELRARVPDMDITWIAYHPSTILLEAAGERLHPEASVFSNNNMAAEQAAKGYSLNLFTYSAKVMKAWAQNVKEFLRITAGDKYDLVIADEAYEIGEYLPQHPEESPAPFVMIYDFVGLDAMSSNPLERLILYKVNRGWSKDHTFYSNDRNRALFVGELEDVLDRSFGLLLPNRRVYARDNYHILGNILTFDPVEYTDRDAVRKKLGYGTEPLVICTVGGTAVGKLLLQLCGEAYPLLKERIPDLRMVMVRGPRLPAEGLNVPQGVETMGYVADLHEHLAACDLAITIGSGNTTLELTALQKPFLYFPIKGHCEQELSVALRVERHKAGVKMLFDETTPQILAQKVFENIGEKVSYPQIQGDGARKAAEIIAELV